MLLRFFARRGSACLPSSHARANALRYADYDSNCCSSGITPRFSPLLRKHYICSTQPRLALHQQVEEESLPGYDAEDFYPVNIGDDLHARYHVIGKLGYGSNSTVWLCKDLQYSEPNATLSVLRLTQCPSKSRYVAAKVCTRMPPSGTNPEKVLYERLQRIPTIHPGIASIRPVLDTFDLVRKNGNVHVCLIYPPLQCTMFAFQRVGRRPVPLSEGLVKAAMRNMLEALDYLHPEADVIHCGMPDFVGMKIRS